MKKFKDSVVLVLLLVLVFHFSTASAGVEYVRRLTLSDFGSWYTYNGTSGQLLYNNSTIEDTRMYTHGDPSDYTIDGKLTFTPLLESDFSTTSLAKGRFTVGSGVTISLTGTVKENNVAVTGSDVVILQATVWGNPEKTQSYFDLIESSLTEHQYELTELYLTLDNVGLASGLALNNGDILKIGETEMDLSMTDINGNSNFITSGSPFASSPMDPGASVINFVAAIPEPATLVLLGLGGLLIRRKRF